MDSVFEGLGEARRVGADESGAAESARGQGSVFGRVFDGTTGAPVEGATVILKSSASQGGERPPQWVAVTNPAGEFEFAAIPNGTYEVHYIKSGYRGSVMTGLGVTANDVARADFPLPPLPAATAEQVLDLEAFVVEESVVGDMMSALELRMESDEILDIMSAEDLSKYAASDVADAIKRVAGVNVVEGQFAIIRGLEDRYSSTLYNGAPVPSPDPDRQSVQLDLFPSEVVNNLVVAKTFSPASPSNSAGGTIDIISHGYPETFEVKLKAKGGFNQNTLDRYLEWRSGTPVGREEDASQAIAREFGGFIGGRNRVMDREVRYKALASWDVDYDSAFGFQEGLEPRTRFASPPEGDLESGTLSLTTGSFDLTESGKADQLTGFGAMGFDVDPEGNHKIDGSVFWTKKSQEVVQLKENGFFPDYDYNRPGGPVERENNGDEVTFGNSFDGTLPGGGNGNVALSSWIGQVRDSTTVSPGRGPLWFSSFMETKSFERKRDLFVPQINGDHTIGEVPGLHFSWAANYARTTQRDNALGARAWYEPCGYSRDRPLRNCPDGADRIEVPTVFPVRVADLGPGKFVAGNDIFKNDNEIDEVQWFGRLDGDYETALFDWLDVELTGGGWYEQSKRNVDSSFLPANSMALDPRCVFLLGLCTGSSSNPAVFGDTLEELGNTLFTVAYAQNGESGDLLGTKSTTSEADRRIWALNLGGKSTLFQDLDLFAGVRFENIDITSLNDPFEEGLFDQDLSPLIFPSKFLIFDRFGDNVVREGTERDPPYNDEVIGFPSSPGPCRGPNPGPGVAPGPEAVIPGSCVDLADRSEIEELVNGEIDERKFLPAVGFTYRPPLEGLTLRGAWSQTVARPSFRELGYYVSVEPASDDLVVGNPQLGLSDVTSYDLRAEYVYGESGDLFAVSAFYKTIQDPIESVIVRNPVDSRFDSAALFRTFFNNPNEGRLWGIEVEARNNLGFIPWDFMDHWTVGGNFTYIDARVDRTEAELARSENFFQPGGSLDTSRRLFGQPEWIANADISFDHPDWGTQATLAFFAISDVLDAAGAASIGPDGRVAALTLDRYVDSFYTLDFVFSQRIWRGLGFRFTAKNLTDSKRKIVYDPAATSRNYTERALRVGREFKFQLSYSFSGLEF